MAREGLDVLIADGRILKGSDVNLAQAPIGVSVRAGAPKPDIRTVEAFKKTLLAAKVVTFPSSTTGIYMVTKLFPRLGIANAVANKTTNTGVAAVAKGDADMAIQPVSELLHVPGTEFVGTIPAEIQYISVFSAAIVSGSQHIEESKPLLAFLMSERVLSALKNSGMERRRVRRGERIALERGWFVGGGTR
jgi:molybdate transport system substrate-binding protein